MNKNKIIEYLECDDPQELFDEADKVRKKYCGEEIHLRGLVEFSNSCARNCLYCGLRHDNKSVIRYRMSCDEIIETAKKVCELGYKTIVLQSGEDCDFSIREFAECVATIKERFDLAVTLCVGELSFEEYKALKEAGADRYLLRFETSNKELFNKIKPDSCFEKRLQCLKDLRALDYQVGTGIMVGIPGQTVDILADDILLMKDMSLDMIGLGPFIMHPDTPLSGNLSGTLDRTLRVLALTRILTKNTHMPATTAMGSIAPQGRQKALKCGANVMMPNVTPQKYRKDYQIYPNKICINDQPSDCRGCIEGMVKSLGRKISSGYGHSLRS